MLNKTCSVKNNWIGSVDDEEAMACMIFWMTDICNQFENIQKGDDVSNGEKNRK